MKIFTHFLGDRLPHNRVVLTSLSTVKQIYFMKHVMRCILLSLRIAIIPCTFSAMAKIFSNHPFWKVIKKLLNTQKKVPTKKH